MAGLALLALPGVAAARAPVVESVVVVMRHGVRPPTKDPAMPAGFASQPWPAWPVAPGWLTPHGARAVGLLGTADARRFQAQGLLPTRGCPAPGRLVVVADSDQRTIATAQAWTRTLAPGCRVAIDHLAQDVEDPRFNAIEHGLAPFDPAAANAGVAQAVGPGGLAARDAQLRPLVARLNTILCGAAKADCGVDHKPTSVAPAAPGQKPKLAGALDRASTAAQILLLQYAEGKPMAQVGWGRASAADVTALSAFHALEFALVARPRAVATVGFAGLAPVVRQGLSGKAKVTMIAGHDTNVANLAGLIDAHWQVPGFAADDPAPGGALIIERLRGPAGRMLVRVRYRAQTLDAIRSLAPRPPVSVGVPLPACALPGQPMVCPLDKFLALLG
jgi:4-phytase/acid phosphatase